MLIAPLPADEDERMAELNRLEILYTDPEAVFDKVTADLARIFDVPVAQMNFMDRDLEFVKSGAFAEQVPREIAETKVIPREKTICSHVVGQNEMMVIDDLAADPRFADSDFVQMGARFYAGTPLRSEGKAVGTMCLVDIKPRQLTDREQKLLRLIADGLMSQVKLRKATKSLLTQTRAMANDLIHARAVQRFLLPPSELSAAAYTFTHSYQPMDQIGGDFVDVRQWDDGAIAMLVADVSGHGASAALMSAMTKTAFIRCAAKRCEPHQLLTNLNQSLASTTEPGRFMTALAIVYDPKSKKATLASAGHPPPLLIRSSGITTAKLNNDIPLLIEAERHYRGHDSIDMSAGDRILAFTDGAVEARSSGGKMLETSGLSDIVAAAGSLSGQPFLRQVFQGVNGFAGNHLSDDVALACLELR